MDLHQFWESITYLLFGLMILSTFCTVAAIFESDWLPKLVLFGSIATTSSLLAFFIYFGLNLAFCIICVVFPILISIGLRLYLNYINNQPCYEQRITFANNEEYYKYKRNPKKYLKTASKENYTITKY